MSKLAVAPLTETRESRPSAPSSLGSQESGPPDTRVWALSPLFPWDPGVSDSFPLPPHPPEPQGLAPGGPHPGLPLANLAPPTRTLLPKLIPSGAGREWLERRRATIRAWSIFLDQRRFSRPRNLGELCQRLVRNVEYYQSNYVFVFLGLILYCV